MVCEKCGTQLPDTAKYCTECGADVSNQYNISLDEKKKSSESPEVKTNYAFTSVIFAVTGIFMSGCMMGWLFGMLAIMFAVRALKYDEPHTKKLWVGLGLGTFELIGFLVIILIYAFM
ncbi:MAG: zinc-ribbon domain-containing protein [Ruminococcus flavefaciens]|nr:zinc-ribbon domain-containing protein [Ruminococcus flavefaciens]